MSSTNKHLPRCVACGEDPRINSRLSRTSDKSNVIIAQLHRYGGIYKEQGGICRICQRNLASLHRLETAFRDRCKAATDKSAEPLPTTRNKLHTKNYTIGDHGAALQKGLYSYYKDGYLNDVFITTASRKVLSAHRLVLATMSPILCQTFSLVPNVKNILLTEYALQDVQTVVEAMYTGELDLSVENCKAVTAIVNKWEITTMQPVCEQFMNNKHLLITSSGPYSEDLQDSAEDEDGSRLPIEIVPKTEPGEAQLPEDVFVKTEVMDEGENSAEEAFIFFQNSAEEVDNGRLPIEIVPKIEMAEDDLTETDTSDINVKSEMLEECQEMDVAQNSSCVSTHTSNEENERLTAAKIEPGETEFNHACDLGSVMDPKFTQTAVTLHGQFFSDASRKTLQLREVRVKQESNSPTATSVPDFDFYSCKICGKKFSFYSNLKLHQRRHWQRHYRRNVHILLSKACNRYKCRLCGRLFGTSAAVLEHAYEKHFQKARCKDCKRNFTSFIRLQDHRLRAHSKKHVLGVCVCLQCCRVFRHQANAGKHTPCMCTTGNVTSCRHCNQRFRHQRFLYLHQATCILRDYVRDTMQTHTIGDRENLHESDALHQSAKCIKVERNIRDVGSDVYKPQYEDALFDNDVLGGSTPYQLLRTMIYMIDTYFTKLKDDVIIYREQVKVKTDEKGTFVSFCDAKLTESGQLKFASYSSVQLYANTAEPKRCFVRLFQQYLSLSLKLHDYLSPLFLVAKKEKAPCYWYMQRKLGYSTIQKMLVEIKDASTHATKNGATSVSTQQKPGSKRSCKTKPNTVKYMLKEKSVRETTSCSSASKRPIPRLGGVINIAPVAQSGEVGSPTEAQCVTYLNHWLQGLSNASDLAVFEKLRIQLGGTIADLPPCKLYFVLRHILSVSRVSNPHNVFDFSTFSDSLRDCETLNHIRLFYNRVAITKGYFFEEANIPSLLHSKVEMWYPPRVLPSAVELAAKGLIGDKDPETLLRSVIFLLAATYQLRPTDLQALTRATVVIGEDEKGKYLCFCKTTCRSQNHAHIHEHTPGQVKDLPNKLHFNDNELFPQAPMKVYAIKESPQSCLVHLMSRYLSLSIPMQKSLFCIPKSINSAAKNLWFIQQAVGKRWITNALNQVLVEAGSSVDSMFDMFHSQALEHGSPKLEVCIACSPYTKGQPR